MNGNRSAIAVVVAAMGGAVAAGGPSGVRAALALLGAHAVVLLVGAAVLVLLLNVVPPELLVAPLLLAGAAAVVSAMRVGGLSSDRRWQVLGGLAVTVAGVLCVQWSKTWTNGDRVARLTTFLVPRSGLVGDGVSRPGRVLVRALFARATVDLSAGLIPVANYVEVMVTVVCGRVELVTPKGWPVVAGRVMAASAVRLTGTVDSPNVFVDPADEVSRAELIELRRVSREALGVPVVGAVIVHVAGVGGEVAIRHG